MSEEREQVYAYAIWRIDCPCGDVIESDADFDPVEVCPTCGIEMEVKS